MKKHRKTLLESRLDAQRDTLNAVVQAAGGAQIDLARVLGVTQAAVSKWVTRGWVPLARAREIQRFLSQPFFVAEVFTGSPGKYVSLKDTIAGFKSILSGEYDHLPEQAFYMVGGIDEVIEKAKTV